MAIAIVIHPGCAGRKLIRTPQTGGFSYISESAVSVVMEEMALAKGADENVVVAIVVIVADCNPHAKHGDGKPGLLGYVSERAVVVVVIKLESGSISGPGVAGPIFSVHQKNVRITIVVVINEGSSRPHSLWEVFLAESAVIVDE